MKALIFPDKKVYSHDGTELGLKIVQVAEETFEVSTSMFWVDCPEDCAPYNYYYLNGEILPIPPQPEEQVE